MEEYELIKTSDPKWLEKAIMHYSKKTPFKFLDDAGVGITAEDLKSAVTLIKSSKEKAVSTWRKIAQILAGLGISGSGIWVIWLAVMDPEPTSKLSLLVIGGLTLLFSGGQAVLRALGQKWKITVKKWNTAIIVEPKEDKKQV